MTPAEKMAGELIWLGEIGSDEQRIANSAEEMIRRLAAALVDADRHIDTMSRFTVNAISYEAFIIRHADALRDVKEMP